MPTLLLNPGVVDGLLDEDHLAVIKMHVKLPCHADQLPLLPLHSRRVLLTLLLQVGFVLALLEAKLVTEVAALVHLFRNLLTNFVALLQGLGDIAKLLLVALLQGGRLLLDLMLAVAIL